MTVSNSSLFTPALLRTHSFVFFAVHETRRIFPSPFISKALLRASSFFLRVQLHSRMCCMGLAHTRLFARCKSVPCSHASHKCLRIDKSELLLASRAAQARERGLYNTRRALWRALLWPRGLVNCKPDIYSSAGYYAQSARSLYHAGVYSQQSHCERVLLQSRGPS